MINNHNNVEWAAIDYDSDGVHRGFEYRSPLCINTFRFDLYNDDWEIDRILVFEALIIYSFKYGNPFYKQMGKMERDLRLTKYSIRKHINFLIDKGYLEKKLLPAESNYKNEYTIIYPNIIDNLDSIYKFKVLEDEKPKSFVRHLYRRLFESYDYKTHSESLYEGRHLFKASKSK